MKQRYKPKTNKQTKLIRGVLIMNAKHTFYIGLNDKDSKIQMIDTLTAARLIQQTFAKHKTDCTITNGNGVYTHSDGTITTEQTIIVTVFEFGNETPIIPICNDLKQLLNQESIAVETQQTNSALY